MKRGGGIEGRPSNKIKIRRFNLSFFFSSPNYLHSISLAELETLGQQRSPQQAAARGHNTQQASLPPAGFHHGGNGSGTEQMLPLSSHQTRRDTALARCTASSQDELLSSRTLQTCVGSECRCVVAPSADLEMLSARKSWGALADLTARFLGLIVVHRINKTR